jgi:uncharacterized protein (DUF1499 family)
MASAQGKEYTFLMIMAFILLVAFAPAMIFSASCAAALDVQPILKPCPSSPNCVSSMAPDKRHAIAPLHVFRTGPQTLQLLKEVIAAYPGAKLITATDVYIHAEFRVNTGFIDDVEFLIDSTKSIVHVRSASRIGYWDFGANRKRIEKFRQQYNERFRIP